MYRCCFVVSALSLVDEIVSEWLVQHGAEAKTSASLRKHAIDVGNATRQMLRLAGGGPVRHNRHRRPFPLELEVPGFQKYLRSECGLMESTIDGDRHHLHEFGQYLRKAGISSLGNLSPTRLTNHLVLIGHAEFAFVCESLYACENRVGVEMCFHDHFRFESAASPAIVEVGRE